MDTMTIKPASHFALFFAVGPYVHKETPEPVYADLIAAYKFYRVGHLPVKEQATESSVGYDLEEEMVKFGDYWEKVRTCDILPEWWVEEENEPEIMRLAREDDFYKITGTFDFDTHRWWFNGCSGSRSDKIITRLGSMSENIYGKW